MKIGLKPTTLWQHMDTGLFGALLLLLAWAPLPQASYSGWAMVTLAVVLCILLVLTVVCLWAAGLPPFGVAPGTGAASAAGAMRWPWLPLALLGAFACLHMLQLLPLPSGLLHLLAPPVPGAAIAPQQISVDPDSTAVSLLSTLSYGAAFALVLLLVRTPQRLRLLMATLVACGVVQSLLAVWLMNIPGGYDYFLFGTPSGNRAVGSFANPDHLAGYLLLSLGLGVGLILSDYKPPGQRTEGWRGRVVESLQFVMSAKMLVRLLLVGMVIALVLTRSRGGNGVFFAVLLLIGALVAWRSPQLRRFALVIVATMVIVDLIVVGQWVGLDKVVARLEATSIRMDQAPAANVSAPQTAAATLQVYPVNPRREESLEERWFAARAALGMVHERPWLGFGGGSFHVAFPRFKGEHPLGFYDHAHNDYVEIAATTGLLGLGLLLALVGLTLRKALLLLNDKQGGLTRGVATGVLMATLAAGGHSFVDFNLQVPANALTFTVVLALIWVAPVRVQAGSGSGRRRRSSGHSTGNSSDGNESGKERQAGSEA